MSTIEEIPEFDVGYFNDPEISDFKTENVYYISPNGNDKNKGTSRNKPLKSLLGFKNKVEALSKISKVTLYVEDGDYNLTSQFDLYGNSFGNTIQVDIIGIGNKAEFTTSDKLDNSKFIAINMNGTTVYKYDLESFNISFSPGMSSYPDSIYSVNANIWEAPFLICEGERMYLSSYPKTDKWTLSKENKAVSSGSGFYITAKSDVDKKRLDAISSWSNVFLDGCIGTPYANHQISIKSYNKSNGRITTTAKTIDWEWQDYTGGIMYKLINIKDEVKDPGEYYIDYTNKLLYFIPPIGVNIVNCKIQLAHKKYGKDQGVFYCSNETKDSNEYFEGTKVTFTKVNFSGFRDDIFSEIMSSVKFNKCIFKNTCYSAIRATTTKNIDIIDCRFSNVSGTAVELNNNQYSVPAPRSRLDLVCGNCNIIENAFENIGYLHPWCGYSSPIYVATVGTKVNFNKFNHTPGISILLAQNDNIIEGNIIKDSCFLLSDSGSIYCGRDWAGRGNIIKNNYIYGTNRYFENENWIVGIYIDDAISGNIVQNNHVVGYKVGILLGGGRDTEIKNNVLENCSIPIVADARGLVWMDLDQMYDNLAKVYPDYTNSLWKDKYEGISTLPQSDPSIESDRNKNLSDTNCPAYPKNNIIVENIYMSCDNNDEIADDIIKYGNVSNNNII